MFIHQTVRRNRSEFKIKYARQSPLGLLAYFTFLFSSLFTDNNHHLSANSSIPAGKLVALLAYETIKSALLSIKKLASQ